MPEDLKPAVTEEQVTSLISKALENFGKTALTPVTDQLKGLGDLLKGLQKPVEKPVEKPAEKPAKGAEGTPQENAEILQLRRTIEQLSKTQTEEVARREAAEKSAKETAKESKVRAELQKFNFASDGAAEDAYILVNGQITQDEAGNLLGPGNLPYDAFLKDYLPNQKSHLLAKSGANGSGATGSQKIGPAGQVDINEIKQGITPERMSLVARQIREALTTQS